MKIRTGFVSNSSSSSFIVKDNIDVLINKISNMCLLIKADSSDFRPVRKIKSDFKLFLKNKKIYDYFLNGSIGITFPSINYDTYIKYEYDQLYVDTCNNHNFELKIFNNTIIEHKGESDIINGITLFYDIINKKLRSKFIYTDKYMTDNFKCIGNKDHIKEQFAKLYFDDQFKLKCCECDSELVYIDNSNNKTINKNNFNISNLL